jgi:DNA-binding CsgD family transcriptional regulator/PAS domain-containing protein
MVWDAEISAVVESVYAATLLPDAWSSWVARTTDWLGGIAAGFTVWDKATSSARYQILQHPDARAIDRYVDEEIWRLDPQMPVLHAIRRVAVYTDVEQLDRDEPATREYLRWQMSNANMGHYLSVGTPLSDTLTAGLSIHRAVEDGATPSETQARLAAIVPHVQNALRLGFRHTAMLDAAWWDGLLAQQDEPALLLDEQGGLLRASPSAEALLGGHDGLDVRHGQLVAAHPASDARLQAIIAGAIRVVDASAGAASIARRAGRAALIVSAFPLVRKARPLSPFEAAALVTIVDPIRIRPTRPALWRDAFALTPREAVLAAELLAGHSLESAAATMEMSRNTARTHLRQLFAKTGCSRQSDLVRLLMRIG